MPTIDPMQQEAMRRVQAMQARINQSRAQRTPNVPKPQKTQNVAEPQRTQNVPEPCENKEEHMEETKIPPHIEIPSAVSNQNITGHNKGPIDILLKDKEQNLILLLIVLLAGDGSNQNLLLALIYLLI
ncbi:MAG: hypothetical protein J1E56_01985 [Ruminococcus sp.]|nr:hypothetical protein [Ruminococcus sp.]